jgi:hypothetical protein
MRANSTLLVTEHAMKMNNSSLFCRREGTTFNVRAKIVSPPKPTALPTSKEA